MDNTINKKDFNIFNKEDYEVDFKKFVLWQYKDTNLEKFIEANCKFFNENVFIFFRYIKENILNLDTADDYGLSLWGALYKANRICRYNDNVFELNTEEYRKLIKTKILLGNVKFSKGGILEYLDYIFPNKPIRFYTSDNRYYYYFDFTLTEKEIAIITENKLMPCPEGCILKYGFVILEGRFGFSPVSVNFNKGPFGKYIYI